MATKGTIGEVMALAHNVVVAVDGSEASKLAVLWAARNVLKPADHLHLVMVSALSIMTSI